MSKAATSSRDAAVPGEALDALAVLRAAMDLLPVGVVLVTGDDLATAQTKECNAAYAEMVGGRPAAGASLTSLPYTYYAPDRREPLPPSQLPALRAITTGAVVLDQELHLRRPDGEWRVILASAAPVRSDGRAQGAVVVCRDITAQKGLQDALRASETRFRRLVESSIFGLTMGDATGRLTYVNDALLRTLGCTREEVQAGKLRWDAITPPEFLHLDERANAQIREHGRCEPYEKEYIAKDGRRIPILIGVAPIDRAEDGRTVSAAYVVDLTPLKSAQDALRASEEQARARAAELEAVLDAVPAAVLIARDPGAHQIHGNRVCLDLLRLPPGATFSRSTPFGDQPGAYQVMKDGAALRPGDLPVQLAAARGVEIRDSELDLVFADGMVRHVLGNAAPLLDGEGEPRGAVGAFIDITERKRAEEALREANRRKDEFLAVLSHELRNPLAPIRNGIDILTRIPADAERSSRALAVIDRQVTHLTNLVEDLLDVNRITRGKVHLGLERVELRELVQCAVEDSWSVLSGSRLSVTLEMAANPLWVRADQTRIKQVLGNLLNNAAKFTAPGGCVVVAVEQPENRSARVRIKDTGIGIGPEMKQRLFEPFAQADATLARTKGGLGLGLALVKGLVELHGGAVEASSAGPGKGSEFAFTLPLEPEQAAEPLPVPGPGRAGARRRVLVVDDNEDFALTLKELLELDGHEVHVVLSGAEGVDAARRLRPEVILCDIGLPGMDGYQVARALRAAEVGFSGKLIALTGYASPDDKKLAAEAGFDHHVAKLTGMDMLNALVR